MGSVGNSKEKLQRALRNISEKLSSPQTREGLLALVGAISKSINEYPRCMELYFHRAQCNSQLGDLKRYDLFFMPKRANRSTVDDLTSCIERDGKNVRALILRSSALFGLQRDAEGKQDLDKIVLITPNDATAYAYRAKQLLNYASSTHENLRKALQDTLSATELLGNTKPTISFELLLDRCRIQRKLSLFPESIKSLKLAESLDSMRPVLYREMATSYACIGQAKAALEHINYAISLDSSFAEFYMIKARLHLTLEAMTESLLAVSRAIELRSNNLEYHKFRADLYSRLGNDEQAFRDYYTCSELDHTSPEYNLRCAMYCMQVYDWPNAYQFFERTLAVDPGHVVALLNFANLKRLICDYAGAIEDLEKCPETEEPEYVGTLAVCLYHTGRFIEALSFVNDFAEFIGVSADCLFQLGRYQECIEKCIQADRTPSMQYLVGVALNGSRQWEKAVEELRKCDGPFELPASGICAEILFSCKKYDDCILELDELEKSIPLNEDQLRMRGFSRYIRQDYLPALLDWEALSSRTYSINSMMADIHTKIQDFSSAERIWSDIEESECFDKEDIQWRIVNLLNRGRVASATNGYSRVIEDLKRAISYANTETPRQVLHDIFEFRGNVFRILGDFKRASMDLQTALELRA